MSLLFTLIGGNQSPKTRQCHSVLAILRVPKTIPAETRRFGSHQRYEYSPGGTTLSRGEPFSAPPLPYYRYFKVVE